MLVLSRKANETVVVGNDITIMVVRISGNRVYLGIRAPTNVPVDRMEIHERKKLGENSSQNECPETD